jgi:hypothetical protein
VVIDVMPGEDGQLRPLLSEDDANAVVCGLYNARRYCWPPDERPGIARPAVRLTWLFTALPARP